MKTNIVSQVLKALDNRAGAVHKNSIQVPFGPATAVLRTARSTVLANQALTGQKWTTAKLVTNIRIRFSGAPTFGKSEKRSTPVPKIMVLVW